MRALLLFLALISGIALALPANYTSIMVYDETSVILINNTNITFSNSTYSQTFNRTQMNYLLAENSTEVNGVDDASGLTTTTVKTFLNIDAKVDYYQNEIKRGAVGACGVGITIIFEYTDGSDSSVANAPASTSFVLTKWQNPNLGKVVSNITVTLAEGCNSGYSNSLKNDVIYSYNTLSMTNITARGDSTLIVKASGYENSNYYLTLTENTTLNQTAYLLATASAVSKQFTIQDTLGTVIPSVKLTIKRFINDTWQVVKEAKTDSSGIAVIPVEEEILYSVTFTAPGYVSLTQTYTGNTAQVLVTIATETGLVLDHWTEGIYWTMLPSVNALKTEENQTISFTAVSDNSSLEDYSLLVYWTNGTLIYNQTTTSGDGGTLSTTMNLTSASPGRSIRASGGFTKAGYPTFYINRTFYIHNATVSNRTLFGLMPNFPEENDLGEIATTIIAVTTVLVVTGGIAATVGGVGAGIVGLLVLGMFTFMGWFSSGLFLAILVVVLSIYYLRGG